MSQKLNWEKVHRDNKVVHLPSPRSAPSTQKQLKFINGLIKQKGVRAPTRLPLTKQGASDMIERLKLLPDAATVADITPDTTLLPMPESEHQDFVSDLRQRFPDLSPQTAHSLVHLFEQVDKYGTVFIIDEIIHDEYEPQTTEGLIYYIVQSLVEGVENPLAAA